MKIKEIPKDAVLINGTFDEYVDKKGNVYGYNHRNNQEVYPYKKEQQTICGYKYVPINYKEGRKSKRVHRIVAEAFIPNPNNYPIVMHIDNNKKNNCVENLKWGTISENTKQAFDDELLKNDKSWDDSQSKPCSMYETTTNKLVKHFGSMSEAEKETNISKTTIRFQIEHPEQPLKKDYYFTNYLDKPRNHFIIVQYDFDTDTEINRFSNIGKASKATGIKENTISCQVGNKSKPKWCKNNFYFKRMYLKCEEVIEIPKEK